MISQDGATQLPWQTPTCSLVDGLQLQKRQTCARMQDTMHIAWTWQTMRGMRASSTRSQIVRTQLSWSWTRRTAHHWEEAKASAWTGDPQRLTVLPWLQQVLPGQDEKVRHLPQVGVPGARVEVPSSKLHHRLRLTDYDVDLQLGQRHPVAHEGRMCAHGSLGLSLWDPTYPALPACDACGARGDSLARSGRQVRPSYELKDLSQAPL